MVQGAQDAVRVEVVIVSHLGGPLLEACVDALRSQEPRPARVHVVLSNDRSVPVPADIDPLQLGANPGFAVAANVGLTAASGADLVVLLNDDTRARPGFLAALRDAHLQHGRAILQPRILLADGSRRNDNLGHHLFPDGFNLARGRGSQSAELPGRVGAFSGAAVAFCGEVLREVGHFDEDLEAFGEDVDLSLRAHRRGVPLLAVPGACIEHELGATYGRTNPRKVFLVERNRLLAAVRSLPASALATMPVWTGLRMGLLAVAAARGQGIGAGVGLRGAGAVLAGGVAGVLGVPGALRKRSQDRPRWQTTDREMWRHLAQARVRWSDVVGGADGVP